MIPARLVSWGHALGRTNIRRRTYSTSMLDLPAAQDQAAARGRILRRKTNLCSIYWQGNRDQNCCLPRKYNETTHCYYLLRK